MKSYDYEAVTYNGEVYCVECLPEGVDIESDEVMPIFADSAWESAPVCCVCGCVHDYVTIIVRARYEPLPCGWKELELLRKVLDTVQDADDTEQLIRLLQQEK